MMDGWKKGWKEEKNIPMVLLLRQVSPTSPLRIFWSKFGPRAWKQQQDEGRRNSSSCLLRLWDLDHRLREIWEGSQPPSEVEHDINYDSKRGVKGLQAPEILPPSIKDGIKWRLSLIMCRSRRRRRWRTRDEKSFYKCAGQACPRCPSTDPHHGLRLWFSTCLEAQTLWGRMWTVQSGGQDQWDDAGGTLTRARHRTSGGGWWLFQFGWCRHVGQGLGLCL